MPPKPTLTTIELRLDSSNILSSSVAGAPKFSRPPPSRTLKSIVENPTLMLSPNRATTLGSCSEFARLDVANRALDRASKIIIVRKIFKRFLNRLLADPY